MREWGEGQSRLMQISSYVKVSGKERPPPSPYVSRKLSVHNLCGLEGSATNRNKKI